MSGGREATPDTTSLPGLQRLAIRLVADATGLHRERR
jgi:hypothetical protein